MLTKPTVVLISQYMLNQTIMPYTLNLHSDECQLFLNKTGGEILFNVIFGVYPGCDPKVIYMQHSQGW